MRHTIIAGAISAALLTWATGATAANPQLKGRYAITGSSECVAAPGINGFNADLTPKPPSGTAGPAFTLSQNVFGVRTYNGDGTGQVEATSLSINKSVPPSASSSAFRFRFTYDVGPNGVFTTELVPGSFEGTVLSGPRAGQTFTNDNIVLIRSSRSL